MISNRENRIKDAPLMNYPGLESETVVLITAGAAGIGRCIAEMYIEQGCTVHVCDNNAMHLDDFGKCHPGAGITLTDVSDSHSVGQLFDVVRTRYQKLDILINNAGIAGPAGPVESISPAQWDSTIAVDLNGVFYCTHYATPLIKQSKGSIVNMSSSAGMLGCPHRSAYVAAKWAIRGLTKTWAMEMGEAGVRVNALCPGSVGGPRLDGVMERDAAERGVELEKVRELYLRQTSLQTFIEPVDIANMTLFLTSDLGRHISGQFLGIDGNTETLADWMPR
jgi:NAD(P)-dependent dehydrogenase (short-subunit alcohol dehydrogenase family)